MNKFKPAFNKQVDSQDESTSITHFRNYPLRKIRTKNGNWRFLIECSSNIVQLSIEVFMEGTKTTVTEKYEFDYLDESKSKAVLGLSALSAV